MSYKYCGHELNLIFDMQQGSFSEVTSFVCRLLRMIKIVTIDMLHELFFISSLGSDVFFMRVVITDFLIFLGNNTLSSRQIDKFSN